MHTQTHIHLVRHGHVHNPEGVFYGRLPRFRLSGKGIEQARRAGRFVGDKPIAALYSSPLLRARQTARELLAATDRRKIRISRLITEIHSPFEGWPSAEVVALKGKMYAGDSPEFEMPQDIVDRTNRFFRRVANTFEGRHVVAVTHGDVIVFGLLWAKGYALDPACKGRLAPVGIRRGYPAHGSVTTFIFESSLSDSKPSTSYWEADSPKN